MRPALRLFAAVQKGANYLEPGAPTGLTGLVTSPAPRTTLLWLYHTTLENLRALPSGSVYRQSTEALTAQRLRLVEEVEPEGLAAWQERVAKLADEHPKVYKRFPKSLSTNAASDGAAFSTSSDQGPKLTADGKEIPRAHSNIAWRAQAQKATRFNALSEEYDARQYNRPPQLEGPRLLQEVADRGVGFQEDPVVDPTAAPEIEAEPALTAEQIGQLEQKIGAGLIEEVIEVAAGELILVQNMVESEAWKDLEEKPAPGQWDYFARDTHAAGTQAP